MVVDIWTTDPDGNAVEGLGDIEDLLLFGKIPEMDPVDKKEETPETKND